MEIKDLDRDERTALVALVELIGESNPEVTEEESARIAAIVEALGAEAYRRIAAEVDERFADERVLRDFLTGIRRQEARELVYGAALEVAMGDTIRAGESALLDWLAREWGIEVRYEVPEGEA